MVSRLKLVVLMILSVGASQAVYRPSSHCEGAQVKEGDSTFPADDEDCVWRQVVDTVISQYRTHLEAYQKQHPTFDIYSDLYPVISDIVQVHFRGAIEERIESRLLLAETFQQLGRDKRQISPAFIHTHLPHDKEYVEKKLGDEKEVILDKVEDKKKIILDKLADKKEKLRNNLESSQEIATDKEESLGKKMSEKRQLIHETMADNTKSLQEKLADKKRLVKEMLDEKQKFLQEKLEKKRKYVQEKLANISESIQERLDNRRRSVQEKWEKKRTFLQKMLAEKKRRLEEKLLEKKEEIQEKLEEKVSAIQETIDSYKRDIETYYHKHPHFDVRRYLYPIILELVKSHVLGVVQNRAGNRLQDAELQLVPSNSSLRDLIPSNIDDAVDEDWQKDWHRILQQYRYDLDNYYAAHPDFDMNRNLYPAILDLIKSQMHATIGGPIEEQTEGTPVSPTYSLSPREKKEEKENWIEELDRAVDRYREALIKYTKQNPVFELHRNVHHIIFELIQHQLENLLPNVAFWWMRRETQTIPTSTETSTSVAEAEETDLIDINIPSGRNATQFETVAYDVISLARLLKSEHLHQLMSNEPFNRANLQEKLALIIEAVQELTLQVLEENPVTKYKKRAVAESEASAMALPPEVEKIIDEAIDAAITGIPPVATTANEAVLQGLLSDFLQEFNDTIKALQVGRQEFNESVTELSWAASEINNVTSVPSPNSSFSLEPLIDFMGKMQDMVVKKSAYTAESTALKNEVVATLYNMSLEYQNHSGSNFTFFDLLTALKDPATDLPVWISAYYGNFTQVPGGSSGLKFALIASRPPDSGSDEDSNSAVTVLVVLACIVAAAVVCIAGVTLWRRQKRHRLYTRIPTPQDKSNNKSPLLL